MGNFLTKALGLNSMNQNFNYDPAMASVPGMNFGNIANQMLSGQGSYFDAQRQHGSNQIQDAAYNAMHQQNMQLAQRGIGSGPGSFSAMGGASGQRKNYSAGGELLVGEQGPEIIRPMSPMEVVPNDALGGKPVSAHFTINAIDAAGVEEVLMEQQGNIISMIRSAANDYGEEFLETVNTDTYGSPKSAGGIDY